MLAIKTLAESIIKIFLIPKNLPLSKIVHHTMKKIKIPWMELIVIFQDQLQKIVEDIKEAREDDSKIDKEEIKDIIAENVVELIVPITQAFLKKNGI